MLSSLGLARATRIAEPCSREVFKDYLVRHISEVRSLYEQNRGKNVNGVWLPGVLEKKYPNAGKEWGWFWLFPLKSLAVDPRNLIVRRHHVHPASIQKAFEVPLGKAGVAKQASVHTLRHSFATHPGEGLSLPLAQKITRSIVRLRVEGLTLSSSPIDLQVACPDVLYENMPECPARHG
ncbi:MAG: hypothetical protein A2Y65_04945 [Deltaproteobacteria bacterium RBG_13_52_11]|nr:MAG: hypothetical protein A2Y65_04945 [Deltaproteobacteria bacterium RBG_13_52_11]